MGISLVIVKSDTKKVEGINVSPIHLKYSFKGGYKRFPTHQFIEQKYWKNGVISNRHPQYTDLYSREISDWIIKNKHFKKVTGECTRFNFTLNRKRDIIFLNKIYIL